MSALLKSYYHHHDVRRARVALFESQASASDLFPDNTMGPLGTEGFRGSKGVLQNDRAIYSPGVRCAWPTHIITPGTSFGMNIDPK